MGLGLALQASLAHEPSKHLPQRHDEHDALAGWQKENCRRVLRAVVVQN
jgi:hypothetical protein